jgi:hypothetical protein
MILFVRQQMIGGNKEPALLVLCREMEEGKFGRKTMIFGVTEID